MPQSSIRRAALARRKDYVEDAHADMDINVVMNRQGRFVELQGTIKD